MCKHYVCANNICTMYLLQKKNVLINYLIYLPFHKSHQIRYCRNNYVYILNKKVGEKLRTIFYDIFHTG